VAAFLLLAAHRGNGTAPYCQPMPAAARRRDIG
jgi:hypothetical protein